MTDERFTLANERTFLAWMRTALGLIAAGVAVSNVLPDFSTALVRNTLGVVLILFGAVAAIVGVVRWSQVRRALEGAAPMPDSRPLWLYAAILASVGVVAAIATVAEALA